MGRNSSVSAGFVALALGCQWLMGWSYKPRGLELLALRTTAYGSRPSKIETYSLLTTRYLLRQAFKAREKLVAVGVHIRSLLL
jgi:hypothetical protein